MKSHQGHVNRRACMEWLECNSRSSQHTMLLLWTEQLPMVCRIKKCSSWQNVNKSRIDDRYLMSLFLKSESGSSYLVMRYKKCCSDRFFRTRKYGPFVWGWLYCRRFTVGDVWEISTSLYAICQVESKFKFPSY